MIAVANQKGGSAKTTTTLNLGAALAKLGRQVLLIDADPQGHLIDCPPSLGVLTVNALSAADTVLIPMTGDYYSLLGVGLLLTTVEDARRELNPTLSVLGVLPTRMARTVNAHEVLQQACETLGDRVVIFPRPIPETVKFREAAALGQPLIHYAPDSPGARAYMQLAEEIANGGKKDNASHPVDPTQDRRRATGA